MGAAAVLADSFARIFFSQCHQPGAAAGRLSGASAAIENGWTLSVDLSEGTATVRETARAACEKLGPQAMEILDAGGIKPLMRARMGVR